MAPITPRVGRSMSAQVGRVNGGDDPISSPDVTLERLLDEVRCQLAEVTQQLDRMAAKAAYFEGIANGRLSPALPPPEERNYLTVAEVCAQTGRSGATVSRWCDSGKIRARKVIPPVGVPYWEIEPNQAYPAKYSRKKGN